MRPQLAQQGGDGAGQEPVCTGDATVVSVVAEVRRDPGVGGQPSVAQIGGQLREADEAAAARR